MGLCCSSETVFQSTGETGNIKPVINERSTLLTSISVQLLKCIDNNELNGFDIILKNIDSNDLITIINDKGYNIIHLVIIGLLLERDQRVKKILSSTNFCKLLTINNILIKTSILYLHVIKFENKTNIINTNRPYDFAILESNNQYNIILNTYFRPCKKMYHDYSYNSKALCNLCTYHFKTINLSGLNCKELILTLFDRNFILGLNKQECNSSTILLKTIEQEQTNISQSIPCNQPSAPPLYIQPPSYNEIISKIE